jgi:hypothetical protein
MNRSVLVAASIMCFAALARGQSTDPEARAAIAVADSVLAALSRGDGKALAALIVDSAVVGSVSARGGTPRASLRSWSRYTNAGAAAQTFTERGFNASARVQGGLAMVWMPYDLYIGERWSHCGVDLFTMVKHDGAWRVASLVYTVEQPPACEKHPAGPPGR